MTEKALEACNDVFAGIVNGLLFQGKPCVLEDELEQGRERSVYTGEKSLREQERDTSKFWKKNSIRIACIGFENETEPEDDMPFRNIGYDGAAYRDQISYEIGKDGKRHKVLTRYPVVTLVLYFGYRKHWDKAKTIYETLGRNLDERLKPYVHDYPINLFEIAWLTDEQIAGFKSDFRIVADYFVQMRKNNSYIPSKIQFRHVREVRQLMSVLTNDRRFEEDCWSADGKGDEPKNMCEVLDRIENKGISIGEMKRAKDAAFRLKERNTPVADIAYIVGVSTETVNEWFSPQQSEKNMLLP